jgi:hypothetical protein
MSATMWKPACALLLFAVSSIGVSVRGYADTIKFSGAVVGSGSDKEDDDHAKTYSGDYDVTFDYTIATKKLPDGTTVFDPAGASTVKLTDTSEKFGSFTTLPIKVTGATFGADGSLTSFMFSSMDWYPDPDGNGITNNGLSGSVDLSSNVATVTSSYIDSSSKSIYTYKFTAVPEPAEWVMILTGLGGLSQRFLREHTSGCRRG